MKLTISAVIGGIGRQVLEQPVASGHDVTAVARDPKKLSTTALSADDPVARFWFACSEPHEVVERSPGGSVA